MATDNRPLIQIDDEGTTREMTEDEYNSYLEIVQNSHGIEIPNE